MTPRRRLDSVDSISATLARIVRLSVSRSAFARQAAGGDKGEGDKGGDGKEGGKEGPGA